MKLSSSLVDWIGKNSPQVYTVIMQGAIVGTIDVSSISISYSYVKASRNNYNKRISKHICTLSRPIDKVGYAGTIKQQSTHYCFIDNVNLDGRRYDTYERKQR